MQEDATCHLGCVEHAPPRQGQGRLPFCFRCHAFLLVAQQLTCCYHWNRAAANPQPWRAAERRVGGQGRQLSVSSRTVITSTHGAKWTQTSQPATRSSQSVSSWIPGEVACAMCAHLVYGCGQGRNGSRTALLQQLLYHTQLPIC